MSNRFRYRMAFFFGRKEHFFSRLLFLELSLTNIAYGLGYHDLTGYGLIASLGLWLIYWLCHNLEKAAFPRNVR